MSQSTVAAPTAIEAIDDTVSHHEESDKHTGDTSIQTPGQLAIDDATNTVQTARCQIEGQRANLLYAEDLEYLPMQKDPRYVFYRHPNSKKFNVKNESVLKAIKEKHLLEHLELLQVSISNKFIELRFDSEQVAQHFVDSKIRVNGNIFAFWRNAQRWLRVSIHEVDPNFPNAALEHKLMQYFGGVLEVKQDTKQYKTKVYQTVTRTFTITGLYQHIPRSCRIRNRWCLVYYIEKLDAVRKPKTQAEICENGQSDPDKEESMSTSETDTKLQKDLSDDGSDASFETVKEKYIGFSSKSVKYHLNCVN